jgi:hypothetical protein
MVPIMAYGVAVTVTLLLGVTTYDYLVVAFPRHTPAVLGWSALATPILVGAASGVFAKWRASRTRTKEGVTEVAMSTTAVRSAAYGILVYAVLGPFFAGVISDSETSWWLPPSLAVVSPAIGIGLVFPAALMIALIQAVPPLSTERTGKPRDSALSEPEGSSEPTTKQQEDTNKQQAAGA